MSATVNDSVDQSSMDRGDKEETIVDIYITAEAVRNIKHRKETEESNTTATHPSEHTGSERVKIRNYRAATLCLVLLCVLLLTAVIVLCVLINTNNHQLHNLTEERNQLLTKTTNLTEERNQLLTNNTNLTEERNQLLTNNTNLTEERDGLIVKYNNITNLSELLNQKNSELWRYLHDGWILYNSSLYFISSEKKSWSESRRYCTVRGADLVIINNTKEQDFVQRMSGTDRTWIGLSDSDKEGSWKWVDGSTLNSGFWASGEPNNYNDGEDCAEAYSSRWNDDSCNKELKWICGRNIFN